MEAKTASHTTGETKMTYTANDAAATFDISATEFDRIAAVSTTDAEFIAIWENTNWWKDAE